jgi:phosphotransferase system HPr (HPr) family protein
MFPERTHALEIQRQSGQPFHLRELARLVLAASSFQCSVQLIFESHRADCKSLLAIASLPLKRASSFKVEACGSDARECLRAMALVMQDSFSPELNHF